MGAEGQEVRKLWRRAALQRRTSQPPRLRLQVGRWEVLMLLMALFVASIRLRQRPVVSLFDGRTNVLVHVPNGPHCRWGINKTHLGSAQLHCTLALTDTTLEAQGLALGGTCWRLR